MATVDIWRWKGTNILFILFKTKNRLAHNQSILLLLLPSATTAAYVVVDVPAGQLSHALAPTSLLYSPGLQALHVSHDEAPSVFENVPAGQCMQSDPSSLPTVSRNLPMGHV
jgi:hypothetical protein